MHLPDQIRRAIVAHARFAFPEEACGLLAADASGRLRMAYCLGNAAESSNRFTIEPAEHYGALRHAEMCGWHIAGVFHSHPLSEPVPSRADAAARLDPSWIHVIAGPVAGDDLRVRAFHMIDGEPVEVRFTGRVEAAA